ncbi:MAG: cytochrome c-type biogenesis CcmF C-terminal domain-containing protein, partial [Nitrospiria bacterium]
EEVGLKSFTLRMASLHGAEGVNWAGQEALFDIYRDGVIVSQLFPQKRFYTVSQTPTTETAIYQHNMGHLFVTIPEVAPDGSWARVRVLYNPLVLWVWYGGGIMGIGAILNIFRKDRKRAAVPEAAGLIPKVSANLPQPGRDEVLTHRSTSTR